MKFFTLLIIILSSYFMPFSFRPAYASDPFLVSSLQRQELVEHREAIAEKLYLGRKKIWNLLGVTLALALFVEIINGIRREPNILEVFSGFLVAAFLSLVIYNLFGIIEGFMNGMAQQIAGSTSYWDIVVENAKRLASADEPIRTKAKEIFKILWFNQNPLAILLHCVNYCSYLFVMVMLKIIKVVQETILTFLHVVAPIVIALSVIPAFNLVPSYILLIISISSWTLFGAIIGKVMSVIGGSSLMLTSFSDLLTVTIANITGGFAILATTRFAMSVFQAGGPVGSLVNQVIGVTTGVAKTIASVGLGAVMGGVGGYLAAGGKTAEAVMSGAVSGAMSGPSQVLRGFLKPKKPDNENAQNDQNQSQTKHGSSRPPTRPKKPNKK